MIGDWLSQASPTGPPRLVATITGHRRVACALAFSPDGHLLAVGGTDKVIALWDVTNPADPVRVARLMMERRSSFFPCALAFNPDGRRLAVGAGGQVGCPGTWGATLPAGGVLVWDLSDQAATRTVGEAVQTRLPLAAYVRSVGFYRDGRVLSAAAMDGRSVTIATVWEITEQGGRRRLAAIQAERHWYQAIGSQVALGPQGRLLALRTVTGLDVWALPGPGHWALPPQRVATLTDTGRGRAWGVVPCLAFDPDDRLLVGLDGGRATGQWDLDDPSNPTLTATTLSHPRPVRGIAASPDRRLVATSTGRRILLWGHAKAARRHQRDQPA